MEHGKPASQQDLPRAEQTTSAKRNYQSPVLTEYGTVEDLVDAGMVGNGPVTVPSIIIQ